MKSPRLRDRSYFNAHVDVIFIRLVIIHYYTPARITADVTILRVSVRSFFFNNFIYLYLSTALQKIRLFRVRFTGRPAGKNRKFFYANFFSA